IYVSSSPVTASGKHTCGKPNFNSVNVAVNDAGSFRSTVIVCTGTYAEFVSIPQPLTLQGNAGAAIGPPGGPTDKWTGPLVLAGNCGDTVPINLIAVKGLTIDGQHRADSTVGPGRGANGAVGLRGENAIVQFTGNTVENVDDPDAPGDQAGIGILV